MGRRVNIIQNENLSQESKEVQDKLLKEITDNNQDNDVEPGKEILENQDNLSNEENKEDMEEPVNDIVKGDRVKINPKLSNDMLGRRIHNGVKNYVYKVLIVRSDGFCSIECLTHVFCVHKNNLIKV